MNFCTTIYEPPAPGTWNMGVDDARLAMGESDPSGPLRLRFYQWSEPTLSLGYFQRVADRSLHTASLNCPIVRRASGGGAILHDQELTYSLVAPEGHPYARDPKKLYDVMHHAIVHALLSFGVSASVGKPACEETDPAGSKEPPFLCFQRHTCMDIFVTTGQDVEKLTNPKTEIFPGGAPLVKICGSAQRRRGGAILQHGSILLERSKMAPELPGVTDLCGISIPYPLLADAIGFQLKSLFNWKLESEKLEESPKKSNVEAAQKRYLEATWLNRR